MYVCECPAPRLADVQLCECCLCVCVVYGPLWELGEDSCCGLNHPQCVPGFPSLLLNIHLGFFSGAGAGQGASRVLRHQLPLHIKLFFK